MTVFVGPNTSGKTNLLEAIYLLSRGKSFRAVKDWEAVKWGEGIARVKGEINSENPVPSLAGSEDRIVKESENQTVRNPEKLELEIVLTNGFMAGQKIPFKKYLINGVSKRQIDFIGALKSVLFKPEDLELITDNPSTRRDYLDLVLNLVDREYRRSLLAYHNGLRQRNRLLNFIKEGKASPQQLFFWDKFLIKNGDIITSRRQEYIDFLNNHLDIFADLKVEYDLSGISVERLEKYKDEEVAAGVTLVGPHRDDFTVYQKKDETLRNVHSFGSRGEQRLAVLSLKLCEMDFIEQKTGERPILLLDDIFSELDERHREMVLKVIPRQQTIVTTTDINLVKDCAGEIKIISLNGV